VIRLVAAAAVISGLIAVTSPTSRPDVVVVAGRPSVTTTTLVPPGTEVTSPVEVPPPLSHVSTIMVTTAASSTTSSSTTAPRPVTTVRRASVPPTGPARPLAGRWHCAAAITAMAAAGAPAATLTTWDALAWRESRCQLGALRATGGDYSVCWWQIEYGHGLGIARTAAFGPSGLLLRSSAACARAPLALWRSAGWRPWS